LWLGLFGAVGLAGGVLRYDAGDPSSSLRSWTTIGVGLLWLALCVLALSGRFGLLVPFLALFLALSLLPVAATSQSELVHRSDAWWRSVQEELLAAAGLAWIYGRRLARRGGSVVLAKSAGAGLLVVFLASVPAFGERLGSGLGMLLGPQPRPTTVSAGRKIPLVRFLSTGGEWIYLREPGLLYVLNLWATWCQPCLEELPEFLALAEEFRGDPRVRFLAVNTEDLNAAQLKAFLEQRDLGGLPVCTAQDEAKRLLGVTTIPLSLLVRDRAVLARYEGYGESALHLIEQQIRSALRRLPEKGS
jgi:thiol-disulfide isomerase/thioredoxin